MDALVDQRSATRPFWPKDKFARDLQDRLGILALLALSAPFGICKLQILLAGRETDPVSGHHSFNNLQISQSCFHSSHSN
jgi:hypothetical protein